MQWKRTAIAAALVAGVAALPVSSAQAHWRGDDDGPGMWPFLAGAAIIGSVAALASAPYRYGYYGYYGYPRAYSYAPSPYYYSPYYYGSPGYGYDYDYGYDDD